MKISYSNYPALFKLKTGKLGKMAYYPGDELMYQEPYKQRIDNIFKEGLSSYRKEIIVIQEPFTEACMKAKEHLTKLYLDIFKNDECLEVEGTFLYKGWVYMLKHILKSGDDKYIANMLVFDQNGAFVCINYNEGNSLLMLSNAYAQKGITEEMATKEINGLFCELIILHLFRKYAEVETKILQSNSKRKEINCKYVNDTNFKLTFLNSKWFTNLVKSDEFKVSGHFRLQPIKDNEGNWTKKLIWISDFMKTGYTSKAKILTQNQ